MRVFFDGFEDGSPAAGWAITGSYYGSEGWGSQRRSAEGVGGSLALRLGDQWLPASSSAVRQLRERARRVAARFGVRPAAGQAWTWALRNTSGIEVVRLYGDAAGYVYAIAGLAVGVTPSPLAAGVWATLQVEAEIDATGYLRVYVDGAPSPVIDLSADTSASSGASEASEVYLEGSGALFDDLAITAPGLTVGAGLGTYSPGDVLTGAISGATARLDRVAASGELLISEIAGTFEDGETITGSVSGAARVCVATASDADAPGLAPGSGLPSAWAYLIPLTPAADAVSACIPSTGTINAACVDDLAAGWVDVGDYVFSASPTSGDRYTLTAAPSAVARVDAVDVIAVAKRTGSGVTEIRPRISDGATVVEGDAGALLTTYAPFSAGALDANPITGARWTLDDLGTLQAGFALYA